MSTTIENLNWRYATKKYDANKKVSDADLKTIKEAVKLSASSYGLQPYKVLVITDPEVREQLKPVSWGQSQITEASHLFVFCSYTNVTNEDIDAFINMTAKGRGLEIESLSGYGDFMKSKLTALSPEAASVWTAKQCYIALGNLLSVCGELKIDATPMEGFEAEGYDEVLGLSEKNLQAVVVAAVGYRSEEDATQKYKKIRKPDNELFDEI